MNVRPLTSADANEVARLWHAGALDSGQSDPRFMPRATPVEYAIGIEAALAEGSMLGWAIPAGDGARLVAYLTAKLVPASTDWSQDGHLYVLDVDVQADQRERGHLRRLMACAAAHARESGLSRIELSWIASDSRADAAWTRLGFRPFIKVGCLDLSADDLLPPPA